MALADWLGVGLGTLTSVLDDTPSRDQVFTAKHPTLPVESLPQRSEEAYSRLEQLTGDYQPAPQGVREAYLAPTRDTTYGALQGGQEALNRRATGRGMDARSPSVAHQQNDLYRSALESMNEASGDFQRADYERSITDRRFAEELMNQMRQQASTLTDTDTLQQDPWLRGLESLLSGLLAQGAGGESLLAKLLQALKGGGGADGGGSGLQSALAALLRSAQGANQQSGAGLTDQQLMQIVLGNLNSTSTDLLSGMTNGLSDLFNVGGLGGNGMDFLAGLNQSGLGDLSGLSDTDFLSAIDDFLASDFWTNPLGQSGDWTQGIFLDNSIPNFDFSSLLDGLDLDFDFGGPAMAGIDLGGTGPYAGGINLGGALS